MKIYVIVLVLCCHQIYAHESYTQRAPLYKPHYQDDTGDNNEFTSSLLAAAFTGAASGLLCRQFEKKILQDISLLRFINIIIWGSIQATFMNTITADLHDQKIKHSPETMKRTAWLISWVSYILSG